MCVNGKTGGGGGKGRATPNVWLATGINQESAPGSSWGTAGYVGNRWMYVSDDMELVHSQAGYEGVFRLTHAWHKLGIDKRLR